MAQASIALLVLLPGAWRDLHRAARARGDLFQPAGVKEDSVDQTVGQLSGGNQQKVVFAKWLVSAPSALLLNDPTRGIDIGARAEIYALIRGLAWQGVPQSFASTDPLELAAVCQRVLVFYNARLRAVLTSPQLNAQTILEEMNTGQPPAPLAATTEQAQ